MSHPNPRVVFTPSPMPVRRAPTPAVHHRSWSQVHTLAVLGCALTAGGCALPWIEVDRGSSTLPVAGTALQEGRIVLALVAIAFVLAFAGRVGCALGALVIAAAAVITVADMTDLQKLAEPRYQAFPLSAGPGLWLVPVGALIAFVGCLMVAFES
jgi:hypothetical protein